MTGRACRSVRDLDRKPRRAIEAAALHRPKQRTRTPCSEERAVEDVSVGIT